MLPINDKMLQFTRLIQISKRLKCEKKNLPENDGVQYIHRLTELLCKMHFLLWVMASRV